jgi:hypothetical protein
MPALYSRARGHDPSGDSPTGGGGLPSGVSLVAADGETISSGVQSNNYWSRNGFSYAAAAGFDYDKVMIIAWWPGLSNAQYVKNMCDVGVNVWGALSASTVGAGSNDANSLTYLGPAGVANGTVPTPVYLIQGCYGGSDPIVNSPVDSPPFISNGWIGWMTAAGAETIGFLPVDEPNWWNSDATTDLVHSFAATSTWAPSVRMPANFQDGRFAWVNFTHHILNDIGTVYNFYNQGNYPAMAANSLNNSTAGVNFGTSINAMTPTEILYTQILNRDGNPRHIDLTGEDMYWFSDPPSSNIINNEGIGGAVGAFYGSWYVNGSQISVTGTFTCGVGTTIGVVTFSSGSIADNSVLEFHASDPKHQSLATLINGTNGDEMMCPVTAFTPGSSVTLGAATVAVGSGSHSNWRIASFTLSPDQHARGSHYGDRVDAMRAYQSHANSVKTPMTGSIENYNQSPGNNWTTILPYQYNAAVWGALIHGARHFYTISGDTYTVDVAGNNQYITIKTGDTVSYYDRGKATHLLVNTLARIINSPFAEGTTSAGFVHVTGDNAGGSTAGFRAPYRVADYGITYNQQAAYTMANPGAYVGANTTNFNRSLASAFEVMAKYYQGATITVNGVTLTNNGFWLFCDYRGSQNDGTNGINANTLTANFTMATPAGPNGVTATKVTRFHSDSIINAVTSPVNGAWTRITCGETQQLAVGDIVRTMGTSGVPGLNNTSTGLPVMAVGSGGSPDSPDSRTTFDVLLTFSGALTSSGNGSGHGAFIAEHVITVTGGSTFSDTFPQGNCIGIYRVDA